MSYRLGKLPARPQSVRLRFSMYAELAELPVPPPDFGYEADLPADSGILGNDQFGDCVFAGAAHETMLWTSIGVGDAGPPATFTTDAVLADYSAVTGFNRTDPTTDQGTDLQEAASYRRKTGVIDAAGVRHLIAAYLALDPGDITQHRLAAWLFGAVGIGLTISDRQIDQFRKGEPWSGPLGPNAGGHYVPLIGFRNSAFLVVTWGRVQSVSVEFFQAQNDESLAYLSEEMLHAGDGPTGLAIDELRTDLAAITSTRPKESIAMSVTTPELHAQEISAGTIALHAAVKAKVPGWEQGFISDAIVTAAVEAVVAAVDAVRDEAAGA